MRPIGDKLVIATHNPGKLREIAALLEPLGIACVGAEELGLPEPEEIGNTFADNADLKAREAADLRGLPALADDSGLCVDALHGRPGIFSARWAEDEDGNRDWMRAMEKRLARGRGDRARRRAATPISSARWRSPGPTTARPRRSTAGSTARSSGRRAATTASATTRCSCRSATSRRSARSTRRVKHAISHRADAFRKLVAALNE